MVGADQRETLMRAALTAEELKGLGNNKRYNRGDINEAMSAAARCMARDNKPYYVFCTYYGYTVSDDKPAGLRAHYRIDAKGFWLIEPVIPPVPDFSKAPAA